MAIAKVTYKGQVTIPKEVRQQMRIREGDRILFIPSGSRAIIERLPRPSVKQLRGSLRASRSYPGRDALRDEAEQTASEEAMTADKEGASQGEVEKA